MFYSRVSGFVFHADEEGIKIISPDRKHVFYLNDLASFIFLSLDQPKTLGKIISNVMAEYQVEKAVAQKDVKLWLEEAIKMGFIQADSKKINPVINFLKKIKHRVFS